MTDSGLLPIDAGTIRTTCERVLEDTDSPSGQVMDLLRRQLLGHVQLLAHDLQDLAACMRGRSRWSAVQALVCASHLLRQNTDSAPTSRVTDEHDLAVVARALLTLYLDHGPLADPVGEDEIAEEIRRQRCQPYLGPIADGEPSRPTPARDADRLPADRCSPCPYVLRSCPPLSDC